MNFCARTGFTAKLYILIDQDKKLGLCDMSSELLTAAETDFVLTFASH